MFNKNAIWNVSYETTNNKKLDW